MNIYCRHITTLKRKRVSIRVMTFLVLGLRSRTDKKWITSFMVCEGDCPSILQGARTQKGADKEHKNLVQMAYLMQFKQTHDEKDIGWIEIKEKAPKLVAASPSAK